MIDLLELYCWCAASTAYLLAWLNGRQFFVSRLSAPEWLALAAFWPLGLLYVAAEWALLHRGYR